MVSFTSWSTHMIGSGFYRPEIWLVPPPHPPTWLEAASVCVEGQGSSVSCPPIWADFSSSGIHQGHQGTVPSCEGQRCLPEGQPWWLACPGLLPGGCVCNRWDGNPWIKKSLLQLLRYSPRSPGNCAFMWGPKVSAWGSALMTGLSWPPPWRLCV